MLNFDTVANAFLVITAATKIPPDCLIFIVIETATCTNSPVCPGHTGHHRICTMPKTSIKKLLAQIHSHVSNKEYAVATKLSKEVLEVDPENYNALVFIGVASNAQGDTHSALESYQRAIDLRPEQPLAYKGVIKTLTKPDSPVHPLILARSYYGLATTAPDQAASAFPNAVESFFNLASAEPTLVKEAVTVLRAARDSGVVDHQSFENDCIVHKICKLLSLNLPARSETPLDGLLSEREMALDAAPLSSAIDDLASVLVRNNHPSFYDGAAELVVERALWHSLRMRDVDENFALLRKLSAYEAILHIAESDCSALISPSQRETTALKGLHMSPFYSSTSRSKAVVSAMKYNAGGDIDAALRMGSFSSASGIVTKMSKKPRHYSNCTQALVASFLHLCNGGFKISLEASRAGFALACEAINDSFTCLKAMFLLLSAAALSGDRKYKEAIQTFEDVRNLARTLPDVWLEDVASRGLVETTVYAYGRASIEATKAIEEAATSSKNHFGALEITWSDAVNGHVNLDRMAALAKATLSDAKGASHTDIAKLRWEYTLLSSKFARSPAEIAAVASIRLGQMILKENGSSVDFLTKAQKCQMEAAGLVRNWVDPFAHLGFIFEQFAKHRDSEKMILRAIRCYERALGLDAVHVIASRRLVRLLNSRNMFAEAAEIARNVSDQNPKARWAFNVLGWWRTSRGRYVEAASAFQAALRGKALQSSKEKDILFGTDVGSTIEDNDLLVDVDSWRGLSVAYNAQGKTRASIACLQDAIDLVEKPTLEHTSLAESELLLARGTWRKLLHLEKAALVVFSRRSHDLSPFLKSVLGDGLMPPAVGSIQADALMYAAAAEWSHGCYRKAFQMRKEAAEMFGEWLTHLQPLHPRINCAVLFKRLGDMWMEAAGDPILENIQLVSKDFVDTAISNALSAYSKAGRFAPWDLEKRVQDIAAALQHKAILTKNGDEAKTALSLLTSVSSDGPLIAHAFLTFALLSSESMKAAAKHIALRVLRGSQLQSNCSLGAAVALAGEIFDDTDVISSAATDIVKANPTDWRAWYVIGKVREHDAKRHDWDLEMVASCENAFIEAERLGGGPAAVGGILRCVLRRLETYRGADALASRAYDEACYGVSLAGRLGAEESQLCRSFVETFIRQREQNASCEFDRLTSVRDTCALLSHIHMFPFLRDIRPVTQVSPAG